MQRKNIVKAIIWTAVSLACFAVAIVAGTNVHSTRQAISRQDTIREVALREPEPNLSVSAASDVSELVIDYVPHTHDTSDNADTSEISGQSEQLSEQPEPANRLKPRKPNERFINFEELWKLNPDVVAWIEIPGTVIDYPIVSTLCNQFYIDHDLLGIRTGYGALFTDIRNNPNWEDPFIVVYGHNMRDGRKFSDLHRFSGRWFFDTFRTIHIYTPDGQLDYRIFAAYERDDEHLMHGRNFRNPETMRQHLDTVRNNDWQHTKLDMDDVTEYDSILVLSTCVGSGNRRFIVEAVFVEPDVENSEFGIRNSE